MEVNPLNGTLVLLSSGVAAMGISGSLKLSPVIGFFVAGAIVGPFGLGLVNPAEGVLPVLAELGVCFLLFDAGLHISVSRLKVRWRQFAALGGLQSLLTTALVAVGAHYLFHFSWFVATLIGFTLALSSTAIVLKILHDEHEEDGPTGSLAIELLVFQDLVGIFLLVLIASLGTSDASISETFIRTVLNIFASFAFVAVASRLLLRRFFTWVTKIGTDEVFTAAALLFVLCTCWVTHSMGLSLALGAFLAGMTLSESNYSYLVRTEVAPFRSMLLSLFFLTVGMSLDLTLIIQRWDQVLLGTLALMLVKAGTLLTTLKLLGVRCDVGTRLGFLLSQGSEFAFVIFALCATKGQITAEQAAFLSAVVGVSMLATPLLGACGCKASRTLARRNAHHNSDETTPAPTSAEVVIVEFDEIGRDIASALIEANVPYRGHDRDWERISFGRSRGFEVHFSDPNRPRTLSRASVGEVRAVVCLVEDDEILEKLLTGLKQVAPQLPIVGATNEPHRLEIYARFGIDDAFLKNGRASELLFSSLLTKLGYSAEQVTALVTRSFPDDEEGKFFPRLAAIAEPERIAA